MKDCISLHCSLGTLFIYLRIYGHQSHALEETRHLSLIFASALNHVASCRCFPYAIAWRAPPKKCCTLQQCGPRPLWFVCLVDSRFQRSSSLCLKWFSGCPVHLLQHLFSLLYCNEFFVLNVSLLQNQHDPLSWTPLFMVTKNMSGKSAQWHFGPNSRAIRTWQKRQHRSINQALRTLGIKSGSTSDMIQDII